MSRAPAGEKDERLTLLFSQVHLRLFAPTSGTRTLSTFSSDEIATKVRSYSPLVFEDPTHALAALVLLAFFHLLLSYLSSPLPTKDIPIPAPFETEEERQAALRDIFRDLKVGKWMWPFGWVKWRPAGGGPGEGEVRSWWNGAATKEAHQRLVLRRRFCGSCGLGSVNTSCEWLFRLQVLFLSLFDSLGSAHKAFCFN